MIPQGGIQGAPSPALSGQLDAPPVHQQRDHGRDHFCDPERVPHTVRTEHLAKPPGQRNDDDDITAQRDDQRLYAFAQPFQRAGRRHGNRRYDKPKADDPQRALADADRFRVGGEHPHQLLREAEEQDGADRHDPGAERQRKLVDLAHAAVFPCAVVVADQRAHPLHDTAARQIQEGLQLVIDAQHHDAALRIDRQNGIEEGNQNRRQRQVQNGRNADGIQLQVHMPVGCKAVPAQPHSRGPTLVEEKIHHQRQQLSQAGRQRRTGDPQFRERPKAEDQHRVKDQVAHRTGQQRGHRQLHAADCLEDLFKGQRRHDDGGEGKCNGSIGRAQADHRRVAGKAAKEMRRDQDAKDRCQYAVDQRKRHTVRGGCIGPVLLTCAQMQSDLGVDAYAEADGDGIDKVLQRIDQRKRRHGILTDLRHKKAVYDIVERVDQHGDHHR